MLAGAGSRARHHCRKQATPGSPHVGAAAVRGCLVCDDAIGAADLRGWVTRRKSGAGEDFSGQKFRYGGMGNQTKTQVDLRQNVRPRRGLTSAPGCPKLAQACGEAGRRQTAGLAEDTPRRTHGGPRLPRTNWMCRPDRVVDHRKVAAASGNHPSTVSEALASVLSAGRDRVRLPSRSIRQTERKR